MPNKLLNKIYMRLHWRRRKVVMDIAYRKDTGQCVQHLQAYLRWLNALFRSYKPHSLIETDRTHVVQLPRALLERRSRERFPRLAGDRRVTPDRRANRKYLEHLAMASLAGLLTIMSVPWGDGDDIWMAPPDNGDRVWNDGTDNWIRR